MERRTVVFFVWVATLGALALGVVAYWLVWVGHSGWPTPFLELVLYAEPAGLAAALLVSLAFAKPVPRRILGIIEALGARPAAFSAAVALGLAAVSFMTARGFPASIDEYCFWFQARLFSAGRLVASFPPEIVERVFSSEFADGAFLARSAATGSAVVTYWPGFSALLAPFLGLGAPWLLNPILSALAILSASWLVSELGGGVRAKGWCMALAICSPVFVVGATTLYSTPLIVLGNVCFAALVLRPRGWRAILAGGVGSIAMVAHQPVAHLLFALPWLGWLLWRRQWRSLVLIGVGYLPVVLVVGFGWVALRGGVVAGSSAAAETASALRGLVSLFQLPVGEVGLDRLHNVVKIVSWSVPVLPALAVLAVRQPGAASVDRVLLGSALATLMFSLAIRFDQGYGWGNRYFQPAWMVLPVLAALWLESRSEDGTKWSVDGRVLATCLATLVVLVPVRLWYVEDWTRARAERLEALPSGDRIVTFLVVPAGSPLRDWIRADPLGGGIGATLESRGWSADQALVQQVWPGASLVARQQWGSAWRIP